MRANIMRIQLTENSIDIAGFYCSVIVALVRFDCIQIVIYIYICIIHNAICTFSALKYA